MTNPRPDTRETAPDPRPLVAVTGATGYIGGRLVPRLLEAGYQVRCLARSPAKLQDRPWSAKPTAEIREVDLENVASITASLSGCHAAFYLVHSMVSAGSAYVELDGRLARNFAEAARAAGVERIIYLGGLGETGPGLSAHLASRRQVETELGSTGVPVTVLRAAMIIGSGSASFEILRYLVERLPVMITPRWVSTPCQPIGVSNVIGYLVGCLAVPETTGQTFDIGGPDVMTYREIMQIMASGLGLRHRWIIPIPVLTPRLSSYWIQLVTPLSHAIARPLAEGLRNPVVCRDTRITTLVPQELLGVEGAIGAALAGIRDRQVETSWTMAGPILGDPDWAGGKVFRDAREVTLPVPAHAAFRAVCRLGGGHGWNAFNWLWKIRGGVDRLVGGPGLRRGRRDPEQLVFGEALDFWRVTGIQSDRRLSLRAEMKLPGEALLEFRIEAGSAEACVLHQVALFKPRGLLGLLYWWSVFPFHHFVFEGMLQGIRKEALQLAAEDHLTGSGTLG